MTSGELPLGRGSGGIFSFSTGLAGQGSAIYSRHHQDAILQRVPASPDSRVRVGIICNAKARHNLAPEVQFLKGPGCAMPRSHAELHEVLASFAARDVDVLVIDGGDGTVRDVISAAPRHFGGSVPPLAIVPSGKTNALAFDLGIPRDWTIQSALEAVRSGGIELRSPMEISRPHSPQMDLRGFIFGSGAFVRATALAQKAHRLGAFNGFAVGLSIAGGVAQTIFGPRDNLWRRGEMLRIETDDGQVLEQPHYLMLATTLRRLPTAIRPFGRVRDGLKMLRVDAPPKRILSNLPALLGGSEAARLEQDGYHRTDPKRMRLTLNSGFILDGEDFPGGEILLRRGAPMRFVVP